MTIKTGLGIGGPLLDLSMTPSLLDHRQQSPSTVLIPTWPEALSWGLETMSREEVAGGKVYVEKWKSVMPIHLPSSL